MISFGIEPDNPLPEKWNIINVDILKIHVGNWPLNGDDIS